MIDLKAEEPARRPTEAVARRKLLVKAADPEVMWVGLLVVLGAIILVVAILTTQSFLSRVNGTLIGTNFGYVAIMCLSMACVILCGEIDLSVGATMGLSAAVLVRVIQAGVPGWLAAVVALSVAVGCGAFNGFMISYVGVPSLVLTIGSLALFSGIQQGLLGSGSFVDLPGWLQTLGVANVASTSVPIVLVIVVVEAAGLVIVLRWLRVGRDLYSIGCNRVAAYRAGIRVNRTVLWVFILSGLNSGIAGLLYAGAIASVDATVGVNIELLVIATVLLGGIDSFGGRGRVGGVLGAVVVMAILTDFMVLHEMTTTWQSLVVGVLLICGVIGPAALRHRASRLS
jgi:rhamnose transport system permease protein